MNDRESLLLGRINLKQSTKERKVVKYWRELYHNTRKWNKTKYDGQTKTNAFAYLELPISRLQKLPRLIYSTTGDVNELINQCLLSKGVHFVKKRRKRSFFTGITSREFTATEKHAAWIAQKQWRKDFLFTWQTPDQNKPPDWSILHLNRPRP